MAETKIETRVPCGNEDHDEPTPAVARLSWPDGRYRPTTVCREDLEDMLGEAVEEPLALLIEPIKPEGARKGPKDYTDAIREVERAYRDSYAEPVRAIPPLLLSSPRWPSRARCSPRTPTPSLRWRRPSWTCWLTWTG
ncbi:hypothetical protein ACFYUV_20740 [Nonomuraea sp. NPDC003560]|uniref:hypothetical protein n=1 Tax=Nonomuraea sp. NPDC003560 TaxID=3364341 RepID=UPI0036D0882F